MSHRPIADAALPTLFVRMRFLNSILLKLVLKFRRKGGDEDLVEY